MMRLFWEQTVGVTMIALAGTGALKGIESLVSGEKTVYIERALPPVPIQPLAVEIFETGEVIYKNQNVTNQVIDAVWSVVVLDDSGGPHCAGNGRHGYRPGPNDWDRVWNVNEFVGAECPPLKAGMTFYATWTPTDPAFAQSHYPPKGVGQVKAGGVPD